MNKTKNKPKAPKNVSNRQSGFFRALFMGVIVCFVCWIVLSMIFAFVMSRMQDSNAFGNVLSYVIATLSLVAGGYTCGKFNKSHAVLLALVLGFAVLGTGYAVSSLFDLSKGLGTIMKTVTLAVMLISPVLGARFSARNNRTKRVGRKRL